MIVGVPKEIKQAEDRVALTPAGADGLVRSGHKILVEVGAGLGSGFQDAEYEEHGAEMVANVADIWNQAAMILKVKEPQESEYKYFRKDLIIFTYLHLAAEKKLAEALMKSSMICLWWLKV